MSRSALPAMLTAGTATLSAAHIAMWLEVQLSMNDATWHYTEVGAISHAGALCEVCLSHSGTHRG